MDKCPACGGPLEKLSRDPDEPCAHIHCFVEELLSVENGQPFNDGMNIINGTLWAIKANQANLSTSEQRVFEMVQAACHEWLSTE